MDTVKLTATKREVFGRKTNRLRREGILPGNVFSKTTDSVAVQISMDEFKRVFEEAGETGIIEITVGETTKYALISDVSYDPVSDEPLHIDFKEVNLREKVKATIPVELEGESPVEKSGEGTTVKQLAEIEVEALPGDLPESFIIDISNLTEVDQAVYVKDLKYDHSKLEVLEDAEAIVVKVEPPQEEEVEEVVPEVTEEGAAATETPQAEEPKEEEQSE